MPPVPGSSLAAWNRMPRRNHCVSSLVERWSSPTARVGTQSRRRLPGSRRGARIHESPAEWKITQRRRRDMRKLRIFEHSSLDGVIEMPDGLEGGDFPYGDWTARYRSPAGGQALAEMY